MTNEEMLALQLERFNKPVKVDPDEVFMIDGKKCRIIKTNSKSSVYYKAEKNKDDSYTLFMLYDIADCRPSRMECKNIESARRAARYELYHGDVSEYGLPLELLLRGKISANHRVEFTE